MNENKEENIIEHKKIIKSKMILITIALSGLGVLGLDRLYSGNYILFFFKLITLGGLGFWALIDNIRILYNIIRLKKSGIFGIDEWYDDPLNSLLYTIFIVVLSGIIYSSIIYKMYVVKHKDVLLNSKLHDYVKNKIK
tara:strand:+ start:10070 stop:10483 length:414 start_codon:yes stop_codon:yes gene_type:complete